MLNSLMQQTTYNLDPVEARVHQHHGNSPVNSFTGNFVISDIYFLVNNFNPGSDLIR